MHYLEIFRTGFPLFHMGMEFNTYVIIAKKYVQRNVLCHQVYYCHTIYYRASHNFDMKFYSRISLMSMPYKYSKLKTIIRLCDKIIGRFFYTSFVQFFFDTYLFKLFLIKYTYQFTLTLNNITLYQYYLPDLQWVHTF